MREKVGNKIAENQSGFTPGRSCTDKLFILQQLMEKIISKGGEIHITFIDLKKAYNNVPRNKIWVPSNIYHKLIAMCKKPYDKLIHELYEDIQLIRTGEAPSN